MPITPDTILSMARAFMQSRIFLTAAELDLFTLLAKKSMTSNEVAKQLNATPRGITILLDALVSFGHLTKEDGAYHCPEETAAFLSKDSPQTLMPMIMHSVSGWERWSGLTDIVVNGRKNKPTTSYDLTPDAQATFINAMHTIASRLAPAIVAAIKPGSARRLIDIGGASGSYTQAFLEASPELKATLFDLPPVIEIARKRLQGADIFDRITFMPGNFYTDNLPQGHDLALLSAIIHQNSSEQNIELYKKAFSALESGGRLIVRDHIMTHEHTSPVRGTMFAVNMLIGTTGGGTYSFEEIKLDLETAGFTGVNLIQPDQNMDGLVEACKP